MKKAIYIVSLFLILCTSVANGQNVVLNVEFDSTAMCIGRQTRMKLDLELDAGHNVIMPELGKKDTELVPGIEILKAAESKSLVNNGKREKYMQEYLVTSFDSTLYKIPPYKVYVDSVEYISNSPELYVYNVDINTAKMDSISPLRTPVDVQLGWEEYRDSVYLGVIVLYIVVLLVWVSYIFFKKKYIVRIVKIKPRLPSHIQAMNTIEEIKGNPQLRIPGNEKEYYTRLTDVLRQYMQDRFGFNAMEMTTSEIIGELRKVEDKEKLKELQELLEMADLVKFAKLSVDMYDSDRNLLNAVKFIDRTKNVEEEKVKQPTEKRVVNERSKRQKILLLVVMVMFLMLLCGVVYLLSTDLYNLFN